MTGNTFFVDFLNLVLFFQTANNDCLLVFDQRGRDRFTGRYNRLRNGIATADNIHARIRQVIVTLTGHDVTYGQTVHGRTMYYPEHFRFGHRFEDIISNHEDGRLIVDYDKFHKTVAEES